MDENNPYQRLEVPKDERPSFDILNCIPPLLVTLVNYFFSLGVVYLFLQDTSYWPYFLASYFLLSLYFTTFFASQTAVESGVAAIIVLVLGLLGISAFGKAFCLSIISLAILGVFLTEPLRRMRGY